MDKYLHKYLAKSTSGFLYKILESGRKRLPLQDAAEKEYYFKREKSCRK